VTRGKSNVRGRTVASLQTPPGKGGIAVILLRGPLCSVILDDIFRPLRSHAASQPGALQLGRIVCDGRTVDEAVVRRESDVAEINIHGGPAVTKAVLELLARRGADII